MKIIESQKGRKLLMEGNDVLDYPGRRQFLSSVISFCGLAGLGCSALLASPPSRQGSPEKHKFALEWGHTFEEAFRWKYEWFIAMMKQFEEYLGKDRLLEMLRNAGDEISRRNAKNDPNFSFSEWLKGGGVYKNMLTKEIIELTDTVYEMKVSECLWAKIFKECDAADIGYAYVCYSDFAEARAAHPKLRLERTKTLMQCHDCCNHRWIWQG
jgi:hypothetical protein